MAEYFNRYEVMDNMNNLNMSYPNISMYNDAIQTILTDVEDGNRCIITYVYTPREDMPNRSIRIIGTYGNPARSEILRVIENENSGDRTDIDNNFNWNNRDQQVDVLINDYRIRTQYSGGNGITNHCQFL